MSFKAVIIEDELPARETLKSFLEIYFPEITVIKEIDTIQDAIRFLQSSNADLIFLDVQLKDGKSLAIFDAIDPQQHNIIFTTAYDAYTLEAFQLKSFGYLLKPIKPAAFKEMVNRVLSYLSFNGPTSKKVKIPLSSGIAVVDLKNIVRCESESNYAHIICADGKEYFLAKTLKYVENEIIDSADFLRVHHSHLVNINHIDLGKVLPSAVIMSNGDTVSVSRSKRKVLLSRVNANRA